jgi:aspartate ammonia-lyase|tara:strand:- start:3 stop:353 length:351 start_codon:yes stop_codon:yes gene_type:complete
MKSNKIQHNKKALIEALKKSLGIVTTACKQVGIDRTTYYRYYNNDKKFRAEVDDLINHQKDFVESKLMKRIANDDTTSIIFYLKTKAKDRGYVERQEISHSGDVKTEVVQWKPAKK